MFILDCSEVKQMCYNIKPVLEVLKYFIKIIQFSVPALLIILGTWDMFKVVTKAEDSKVVEEAKKKLIQRLIYGVLLFLVPFIVRLVLNFVEDNFVINNDITSPTAWISCWNSVMNNENFSDCSDIYKKDVPYKEIDVVPRTDDNESTSKTKDCSNYSCPTNAQFENASKKFDAVYYKDNCYCRASIPSVGLFNGKTCSDIKLNSNNFVFAFSETDSNSANDYCYFKGTSSGGSSSEDSKKCKTVCENGGSLNSNNECYQKKLDANTFDGTGLANCQQTCGSKATDYKIAKDNGDGLTYCDCYYPVSEQCD